MSWIEGPIQGCTLRPLTKFSDNRGWLAEIFRHDELDSHLHPLMSYLSLTHPDVIRGPHEHDHQTDLFVFFSGRFKLYLWDTRDKSTTNGYRQTLILGSDNTATILVPPGVVHAYKNVGTTDALIINCPNALYAGPNKAHPVDEIRYEGIENHPFIID